MMLDDTGGQQVDGRTDQILCTRQSSSGMINILFDASRWVPLWGAFSDETGHVRPYHLFEYNWLAMQSVAAAQR